MDYLVRVFLLERAATEDVRNFIENIEMNVNFEREGSGDRVVQYYLNLIDGSEKFDKFINCPYKHVFLIILKYLSLSCSDHDPVCYQLTNSIYFGSIFYKHASSVSFLSLVN